MGSVIATYLSILIANKFKMDAVQNMTSHDTYRLHRIGPNGQYRQISRNALNGKTIIPSSKSATARDTMKSPVTFRRRRFTEGAKMTKIFPIIVIRMIMNRMTPINISTGNERLLNRPGSVGSSDAGQVKLNTEDGSNFYSFIHKSSYC